MATYTGLKVSAGGAEISTIKISSGVHDIFTTSASTIIDNPDSPGGNVLFTSVTVDTANNVFSGYDGDGNRYIIDKEAGITVALY